MKINNNSIIKALILSVLLTFSQLTFCQVTSWMTKPAPLRIPDQSDSSVLLSDNGRYIAFSSQASNYVESDTNLSNDVFIKDSQTNTLTRITNSSGLQYDENINIFSKPTSDGSKIAYNTVDGLVVKNLTTGVVTALTYNSGANNVTLSSNGGLFLTDDGRYLFFQTNDPILATDTNNRKDVYRKDLLTGLFKLISVNTSGQAAAMGATLIGVSRNGKFVAFQSTSSDIHPDATTGENLGYILDVEFTTLQIFSIDHNGGLVDGGFRGYINASISNSGNVYFCSQNVSHVANDNNNTGDIFKYSAGTIIRLPFASVITEITDRGCSTSISGTMFVDDTESSLVFSHPSMQLHPLALETDFLRNLYKLNFSNNSVELLSQSNGNAFGIIYGKLSTSSNNEKVIFSAIDQIIPMLAGGARFFSLNTNTNQIALVAQPVHNAITLNADVITAKMSDNQNQIYFATNATNALPNQTPTPITVADPNGKLYHFNRLTGTTELVTASYGGNNLSSQDLDTLDVSPNGRFAVYNDSANGYQDLILYDSQNNEYKEVGQGLKPKVNDDGNVVFFTFNGFSDVEVYFFDRLTEDTQQVSLNTNGNESDGASFDPDIGGAGLSTWIVFTSSSTDLIASDTNGATDIFMINWPNGDIFRISDTSVSGSTKSYISTNTTSVIYNPSGNSGFNLKKYDRIANTTIEVCNPDCDIDVGFYGISPSGRYISYSPYDSGSGSKKLYLYDSLMDTTSLISVPMITSTPVFHSIGLDDSFAQPKLGVLYLQANSLLDNLYGINNVAGGSFDGNGYYSAFLYQEGGDGETLNLKIQGTGQVAGGLNCQADCQFTFALGTALTLSIIEPAGQIFVGWEGDCIHQTSPLDSDCDVIMDITKTITAKFIDNNDRIFTDSFEN